MDNKLNEWIAAKLKAEGHGAQRRLAEALGVDDPQVSRLKNGTRQVQAHELEVLANFFGERPPVFGLDERENRPRQNSQPNARMASGVSMERFKVPAYGHAIGGPDGRFVLNGNKIADVLAPANLMGVRDAYAVYVVGESMEPRYFAGEAVFINPHIPVRRGDFVVAQIAASDEEKHAYVKRFIKLNSTELVLEQFNPAQMLTFPADRVVSVHRIVASGE